MRYIRPFLLIVGFGIHVKAFKLVIHVFVMIKFILELNIIEVCSYNM